MCPGAATTRDTSGRHLRIQRWLLACAAAVLAVTGCTPGSPSPPADSGSATAAGTLPAATAEKVLSDEELMTLVDRAINGGQEGTGRVSRSSDLRARLQGQPESADKPAVEPGECGVFRPHSSPTSGPDLAMHFAAGVLTLTGAWSREALAFVFARSAPRSDVLAADFSYTDELAQRCSTFRQTAGNEPTSTVRLLTMPAVGEKAYATVLSTPATAGTSPGGATVALQVLQGTLTIGLSRQAATAGSDAELRTALEPLVLLAQKLIEQIASGTAPSAAPPAGPPASPQAAEQRTPQQLARLLQGVTGPSGRPAQVLEGRYTRPGPATAPAAPGCIYDDAAYLASFSGAATVVAEIAGGPQSLDRISVRLVSLPPRPAGPSPFDSRAADLSHCSSIRERLPVGGSRTWTAIKHPIVNTSGEAGYAVVYVIPDGTGIRHIQVGARKGRLCVEMETKTLSQAAVLQAARGLAATINKVMARVGG